MLNTVQYVPMGKFRLTSGKQTDYILNNKIRFSVLIILLVFLLIIHCTLYIENCNAQWTLQGTVNGIGTYPSISVYGPNGIIAAGGPTGSPKVFNSTNGGVNWTDISGDLSGANITCAWAVNENLIFAGAGSGNAKVWKTTNGGVSWTVILTTGGTGGYFNGIVFSRTNPLIGIAQSDPPIPYGMHYLAKTTDGGNTWNTQTTISTNGNAAGNTVVCIDNLFYGWSVYPPPRAVVTSDGGNTWIQKSLSAADYASGLAFSSDKLTGVAVSDLTMPFVSRTTDGGNSWTQINTGLPITSPEWGRVRWVYGTNTVFLSAEIGASGCIGKSTDGGLYWSVMNTSGVSNLFDMNLIYTGGIIYAYAIARDGKVLRLQEPVGVVPVNNNIPSEYKLDQNYPNPFNPSTVISYQLVVSSFATLKVYDMLGKEVVTLVNGQQQSGTYEVEFDGTNYPSGVYYYRIAIHSDKLITGDYSETKKMLMIK
jgi:photosystem II stability/assembly factor-like uncharacterized protein